MVRNRPRPSNTVRWERVPIACKLALQARKYGRERALPCDGFSHSHRLGTMAYQSEFTLARARSLRKHDTEAERRLWERLRTARLNGFKFVRQLPIGPYFADFACRSHRLVVEVDGATHGEAHEVIHDSRRTAFLQSHGWQVMRVWNIDVFKNLDAVGDSILFALESRID